MGTELQTCVLCEEPVEWLSPDSMCERCEELRRGGCEECGRPSEDPPKFCLMCQHRIAVQIIDWWPSLNDVTKQKLLKEMRD